MIKRSLFAAAAAVFAGGMALPAGSSASAVATAVEPVPPLRYLDPAAVAPALLLPQPARPGSDELARELARVRLLVTTSSPERYARAEADGASEDPVMFDAAAGRRLEDLPATYALLKLVRDETEAVVIPAKLYFAQPRPYLVDPSLRHCGKGSKALAAYPSGHAGFGYSVGWALALLLPSRAPQALARADDYALSREICGVHFHADTEASRVLGTVVAERLFADPRLAPQIAAARRELSQP
jgi:acid phosphatase (class A)